MKTTLKVRFIVCQWITAGIISMCCQSAHAQLLFSDSFNYTPANGQLGGQVNPSSGNAWSGGNNDLAIGGANLPYSGLQEGTGFDLIDSNNGSGANTTTNNFSSSVTPVTSGSIYYSFVIDCTTAPTANSYLTALDPANTAPSGSGDQMATYVGASGSGWKIGVRTTGGNSGAVYSGALTVGMTYFVVEELTLGSAPVVNLYVNPTPGGTQPGTPTVSQTGTTASTSVDDVGFKSNSGSTTGGVEDFGDLLIGDTWADVTPAAVPEPSTFVLLGGSLLAAWKLRRQTRA